MPVRTEVLRALGEIGIGDEAQLLAGTAFSIAAPLRRPCGPARPRPRPPARRAPPSRHGPPAAGRRLPQQLVGAAHAVERPAASSRTATRGACCGPASSLSALRRAAAAGSGSRPAGRRRPCLTISARPTGSPAARRSSTMSKPLYLGDLAQPGRPSTGLPSSSPVSSRLPGSTGMPKWMTLPPACSMPAGTTSWRSTIAEAPATRIDVAALLLQLLERVGDGGGVVSRRGARRPACCRARSAACRSCSTALSSTLSRVPGSLVCTSPARIGLNGATETIGWLLVLATSIARSTAVRGAA